MRDFLMLCLIAIPIGFISCKSVPQSTLEKVPTKLTIIDMQTRKPMFPPINQDSEILIGLRGDITIYLPSAQIKEVIQQIKDGKQIVVEPKKE